MSGAMKNTVIKEYWYGILVKVDGVPVEPKRDTRTEEEKTAEINELFEL